MNQHVNMELMQQRALLYLLNFLAQQHYRFTVITPLSHERVFIRKQNLSDTARNLKDIFGWNLPFSAEDLDQSLFLILKNAELIHLQEQQWLSHVRVASLGDQLFIHSAFPTIETDAVFFGPDTYRFYYHLKQYLLNQTQAIRRSVELCCGASPVALAIARLLPDSAEIFTADINPKALFYSQVNKDFTGVSNLFPTQSNLFSNLDGHFDLIFANPPYLMDLHERHYRHGGNKLDGTELALNILKQGITRLTPHGTLFLYTGVAIRHDGNKFLDAVDRWIQDYPDFKYSYEEIDPDVFGEELEQPAYQHIERIAVALVKLTAA